MSVANAAGMCQPPAKTARASKPPPSIVFMSASRSASGNFRRKAGTTFADALILEQRRRPFRRW